MPQNDTPRTFVYIQLSGDNENDRRMYTDINAYLNQHPELLPLAAIERDDPGSARKKFSNRERAWEVSKQIRRGDRLIVDCIDQLGVSAFDGISRCHKLCEEWGIAVHVLHYCTSNPVVFSEGDAVLRVSKWIADSQRESIGRSTKQGLDRRRKAGLPVSKPPYGWRTDGPRNNRHLVEVPHEQMVLNRIWELHKMGLGAQKIANCLTIAAWESPQPLRGQLLFRGGGWWTRQYVWKLIDKMRQEREGKARAEELETAEPVA
jgi:DNA invertase Pin-like site-specific DNA recombinase